MSADTDDIDAVFAAETNQLTAERLPSGALAFVAVLAAAWIFEHATHPDRDVTFGVIFAAECLCLLGAVLAVRHAAWRTFARTVAVATTITLTVLMGTYHVVVQGEAEILAMALLYVVTGTMVLLPWGWQAQLVVALAALSTYVVVLGLGVRISTPVSITLLGLVTISGLSVGGAAFLARSRRAFLRQAAELRAANAALAAADQTKNQFLASVSHELRTPLNAIVGYTDLLQQGEFGALPEEARRAVDRVARGSRNLVYLINDLLDLARIEAGQLNVQLGSVELASVFAEMTQFVNERLENKDVRFHVHVPAGLAVLADRNRLEQILVNLLSNAVKFTAHGEIELRAHPGTDGAAVVEVRDTGVGMDAAELSTIFEPFRQGAAGRDRGGVGIGLSVSARLARAMGGELSAVSALHHGSTFTLRLPAVR